MFTVCCSLNAFSLMKKISPKSLYTHYDAVLTRAGLENVVTSLVQCIFNLIQFNSYRDRDM